MNADVPYPSADRDIRAAEIALGLVDERDRDEAISADPSLADDIARWQNVLASMADELPPVPPAPHVWRQLRDQAGLGQPETGQLGLAAAARDGSPAGAPSGRDAAAWPKRNAAPTLRQLRFWQWTGAGSLAAAFAMLMVLLLPWQAPQPVRVEPTGATAIVQQTLVVSLLPRDGGPSYVATYDTGRATFIVIPADTKPAAGQVPQLWLVPNDTGEPIALGSLDPGAPVSFVLTGDAARFATSGAGLVITLEPAGATLTDGAKGPVIAHGRFVAL